MQHFHIETKLNLLGATLTTDLDNTCKCDFTPEFFFFDDPLCLSAHPEWLILSGRIVGTRKSTSTNIVEHLQLWVEKESKLVVEGVHLTALKYSSVFLQEGEPPFCQNNPPSEPSSSPTSLHISDPESSTSGPKSSTSLVPYLIIAVVIILVVFSIIGVMVCIMVVRLHKRKTQSRMLRYVIR